MDLKNVIELRMIKDILIREGAPNLVKVFEEIVLTKNIELAQFCFSHYEESMSESESESEEETVEIWIETEEEDEESFNYHNA